MTCIWVFITGRCSGRGVPWMGVVLYNKLIPSYKSLHSASTAPPFAECRPKQPTGVCEKKHSSEGDYRWESKLSEHQIGGWRGVVAARLQGKGSRERRVFFPDTGMATTTPDNHNHNNDNQNNNNDNNKNIRYYDNTIIIVIYDITIS